ncbi:hypothetical protein IAI18_03575 [Acetobacteraceae bacterium H6797]|nr:hypothetical protein [Acetobacteraceae bacterium H6797]
MIPVALPSTESLLALLALLVGSAIWLGWAVRLVVSARARQGFRGWRVGVFALLGLVCGGVLWLIIDITLHVRAVRAEYREKYTLLLASDERVGAIDMPRGTMLRLKVPYQAASFDRAEFPRAVNIGGVMARVAERYVSLQTNAQYETIGFRPENIRLTGEGESLQQGWRCDAARPIEFETGEDGSLGAFRHCRAAGGNAIEGQSLPAGADIIATGGSRYTDGSVGDDRWLVHLPEGAAWPGMPRGGSLKLDAERRVIERMPG